MDGPDVLCGRYELRGVLGLGGMAEVRDAWDIRLDRPVAVKLLHPAMAADPGIRRRFEDEARSAAALNHPNIVSVHDCGEDRGRFFIVMERLPGRTLHDLIAQGPLPAPRVRAVLDDILGALAVAHGAGVLHRDIKPANILLSADGSSVKVADFGIAKTADAAHTMTGQIIGTMAYMSPERVAGAPASVADDLYAVGMIGFEATAGYRAFPQDNPASLARAITGAPPPSLAATRPDVDPVLAGVVDRAVSGDPRHRFGSAELMRSALGSAGAGVGAGPRPATKVLEPQHVIQHDGYRDDYFVPARTRRRLTRNQVFLAAAGVFVALLVTTLVLTADREPASPVTGPVATTAVPPPTTTAPLPVTATTVAEPPAPPAPQAPPPKNERGRDNGNGGPGAGPKKRD